MVETMPTLGYVGLGLMGLPMTLRLLDAGYLVWVWNRTAEKARPAVDKGANQAASPSEVARQSAILFTSVLDTAAVESVVFGLDGIAEGGSAGKTLIDLSTIGPDATIEMAGRLRSVTGMAWIDAPVTGGQVGAKDGTLVLMAGGHAADIERVRPHVAPICRRFAHMGPQGAGQVAKLCNQIVVGCTLFVMAEMLAFARDNGVKVETLPDVLEGGFADSTLMRLFARPMIERDFTLRGRCKTMLKDLNIISQFAGATDSALPMTAIATELWRLHVAKGHGDEDSATVIKTFDRETQ